MANLDAAAVADLLDELGKRLELGGESGFKVRAYHKAADTLRDLSEPLADIVRAGKLGELPGVGKAIAEKIETMHATGTHKTLERARADVPDGLLDISRLPGVGPKKVLQLKNDLGIDNLDKLQAAAEKNELAGVKGFGAKLQAKILEGLGYLRAIRGRVRLPDADRQVEAALKELKRVAGVETAEAAGEARRRCETVSDTVVTVRAAKGSEVPERVAGGKVRVEVLGGSPGVGLLYATGSAAHLEQLEAFAKGQKCELSPKGLMKNGKGIETPDEAAVYEALGLPYIEPELREGRGEIERAAANKLPDLVTLDDIKGVLHAHTTFSDGNHTLKDMAETVRGMGLQYFGVADHSQSAGYAGGLKPDRVKKQHAEIEKLNAEYEKKGVAFRVLKGIESDIREDGSLDYDEQVLASFDFIVASVHSLMDMDIRKQTARVVKAVSNPFTTVLGHPTGRLLLRRESFAVDLEEVIAACAAHGTAVEINAHPVRLDLDWRWHQTALEAGAMLSINPDSHDTRELNDLAYGVAVARKGGVDAAHVLTCKGLKDLQAYLEKRRGG